MTAFIGTTVKHPKGDAVVTKRVMTEWSGGKKPSTFYEATIDGEIIFVHENIVHGVAQYEKPKPKGPRKVSTKKERAEKHVRDGRRKRMSRGEIIKLIAQKLRVSKTTAQSYYYQVK